jgi:uncharacterized protein YbjT (DUF2867 family)
MQKILLAGATGLLGRCVLEELKEERFSIRAIGRDRAKLEQLSIAEPVSADLMAPESLEGVCDGVDAVISCAGASMKVNTIGDRSSFYEVDYKGNSRLLAEAQRSRVKKFIYVSLCGGDRLRQTEYADAHERFVDRLNRSDLPYTVIRPTGFYGFHLEILKMARKGRGLVIGDGSRRTNPIHEADVARACVEALTWNETDRTIGGPEILSRKETVELALAVARRRAKPFSMPPRLFRTLVKPLKLINPRIHALMDFGVAVTQVDVIAPPYGKRRLREYFENDSSSR